MKAVVITNGSPTYNSVPDPVLKEGEVLVRVEAAGLCGTDVNKIRTGAAEGIILGHEIAGVVESGKLVGQRIAVKPHLPCYSCMPCKEELYQHCDKGEAIGRTRQGGFAEYVAVPQRNIYPLPDTVPTAVGSLADIVACAIHVRNTLGSAERIAVLGNGAFGLSCAAILANRTVDVYGKDSTPKGTYDAVIETVGRSQDETLLTAAELVKPRGMVIVGGVYDEGKTLPVRELFRKEVRVQGVNGYGVHSGLDEFEQAIACLTRPELHKLVTHVLPLSQFIEGLALFSDKRSSGAVKIVYT